MTAETWRSNEFWGRRSGYFEMRRPRGHVAPFGWAFKVRRGGTTSQNNDGPVGNKRRWYVGRALSKAGLLKKKVMTHHVKTVN